MRASVTRLPGNGCTHYLRGRCLYEETLNPGFHSSWRCEVLDALEAEYDHGLNRAEAFGLDERAAARVVNRQLERVPPSALAQRCVKHGQLLQQGGLACEELLGMVCLVKLPICQGRCHLYQPDHAHVKGSPCS